MADADHLAALVRDRDRDRYYATLLAPAAHRPALFAVAAFSSEIAGIRDAITNPMPGEIRLQWWRDTLAGEARGDVSAHPVASALLAAIARYKLPVQPLLDLLEARTFDLYDDPMPSANDLDGYLGETVSAPIRLACLILADGADPAHAAAAGHAGLAIGATGLLRALPWHARQGRLYLPADILGRHGVTRDDVVLGRGGPGFVASLAAMRETIRGHLRAVEPIPPGLRPAFAPLALVPGDLAAMERPGYDPLDATAESPAWRRIARLWWYAKRG